MLAKYRNTLVDVVHITNVYTGRTEDSTDEDVRVKAGQKHINAKDATGNHWIAADLLLFAADADVEADDEVIFDGKQRPIASVVKPTNHRGNVTHIEVILS